jgi:hypothetical protein|nr:MAG TPA: hypothetical protein [Caudoviricetes sp.]
MKLSDHLRKKFIDRDEHTFSAVCDYFDKREVSTKTDAYDNLDRFNEEATTEDEIKILKEIENEIASYFKNETQSNPNSGKINKEKNNFLRKNKGSR